MLKTNNLKVGYDKNILIDDINLKVEAGKVLTLIGPNGSGKSTILKTITRQLKAIGGSITIGENSMESMKDSEVAKVLSMVMTNRIKPELMSCQEVIETGRFPYTGTLGILSKADKEKVSEIISLLKLEDIRYKSFEKISDGQKQRVMLARALAQEPKVLILDEPTSYLDMKYKLEILTNIRQISKDNNIAIIMSLHELDLAAKVSDVIACVDGKKICRVDVPEVIFTGNFIQTLYGISENEFDPLTATVYMKNKPQEDFVFVISGGGNGIGTFNKLFRDGISFKVGILSENDVEFVPARAMAEEVISMKAFYEITEDKKIAAMEQIDKCSKCICTIKEFGPLNKINQELFEYAKSRGKI